MQRVRGNHFYCEFLVALGRKSPGTASVTTILVKVLSGWFLKSLSTIHVWMVGDGLTKPQIKSLTFLDQNT
jgi:hypothetical protein